MVTHFCSAVQLQNFNHVLLNMACDSSVSSLAICSRQWGAVFDSSERFLSIPVQKHKVPAKWLEADAQK